MEHFDEQTFSKDAFVEKLTSPLLAMGLSADEVRTFAGQVTAAYATPDRVPGRRELVFGNVVIRNDDLQVLETLWKTLPAFIAAGVYTDKALLAAAGGILVGIARLGYGLRKKSAVLSAENVALLLALKQSEVGLTAEELAVRLNEAKFVREYAASDIQARLTELSKVALSDGSVTAFVAQDGRGYWTTQGV